MLSRPKLLAIAVAVVVALAACGGAPKRPRRPGEETLAAIKISGNKVVSSEALIRGLALKRSQDAGRGIDEYQLSLDISRIKGAYERRGYFGVSVEPRVEYKGKQVTLIFEVKEGPRATTTVEITGLPPEVPTADARAVVTVADGDPFDYIPYDEAKIPLLALVQDAGYAYAELTAEVLADREKHQAILHYAFEPGPRVTFGVVAVNGATGDLADTIMARAGIKAGDLYSAKAVTNAQMQVYGIGRFTSARIDVDKAGLATVVPVTITVALAKQWELRIGAGGGLDSATYQARLRFSLSHAGWPTPLTNLGVEFRPALTVNRDDCGVAGVSTCDPEPRIKLIGTARQQDIFTRGLDGEVEGGLDYIAFEAYTMVGQRARVGLDVPLNLRRLRADVGFQLGSYRFEDFADVRPAMDLEPTYPADIGLDKRENLTAFTQAVSIDYRDDPIEPRFGAYAEFRVAEGVGAFEYVQLTPDVRGYLPIGRVVLAARARLGTIRGDVPPTERYYSGGASSQRGFAERRLSPLATGVSSEGQPANVVIGGDESFETGFEVRTHFQPFGFKLGVVAFVDGADVTQRPDAIDVGNLHWAVGVGIRPFYLPVGPFRFEVARRINRTGAGEPAAGERWNYIISVGEAF